jgi:hypothetical protein
MESNHDNPLTSEFADVDHIVPPGDLIVKSFPPENVSGWRLFLREQGIFQFYTEESIQDFSKQIVAHINETMLRTGSKGPVTLLELGAGDGQLAAALKELIPDNITLIPTDDGSWQRDGRVKPSRHPVERLSYTQAMKKYGRLPNLFLLSSWMPMGENWTESLQQSNVLGFFLVGDIEATGKDEETWNPGGNVKTTYFTETIRHNYSRVQQYPSSQVDGKSQFAFLTKQ